jgi:hypothetical protein
MSLRIALLALFPRQTLKSILEYRSHLGPLAYQSFPIEI